ncbi:T9SS type A sorting domain-containing protein [Flavobacterium poyangense]|uniref:T9SS type A sorting domain-containing protein n=1 Tax=Flavobacterium poyangense TaxID=2204302 RepID=UPI0014212E74|nr:T9SS type A sorting domain-containing protein [Flavobacterium sp. JXAS1]
MKKFYLLLLLFLSLKLLAQNPEPDPTFNVKDNGVFQQNIGMGGVVLPNNKILTCYKKGVVEYNVLLLNADGSPDRAFNTKDSFSGTETRIFAKSDGGFLTLTYDGKLKAFHPDGTLNSAFTITTIKNTNPDTYRVNDIIYQDDGKVIIYGAFDTFNDVYAVGFVRLNADGSVDRTFKWKSAGKKIVIQNDGKYVAVSRSTPTRYLADGKLDTSFKVIATVDPKQYFVTNGFETANNSSINDIAVQPDGKVIVVGCNYVENGKTVAYYIVRLNADGTRDTTFKSLDSRSENVDKVYLQKDNKIILNLNSSKFIRLNTDGAIDPTFKYENKVSLLNKGRFYFQGDKMIISADFKDSQGITRSEIHRINTDGSLDMTFNPHAGPNLYFDEWDSNIGYEFASKVLLDQKVLLVGDFTTYSDKPVSNMCRIDQNGEFDSTFKLDPTVKIYAQSSQNGYIVVPQLDGKILLVHNNAIAINGNFKSLIRLNSDGSLDTGFNFQDYSSRITDVKLLENGKILLMGSSGIFVKAGEYKTNVNSILRLNSDGSIDTGFNGAFNQKPVSVTELSNKKILISFYRENNVYGYEAAIRFNADGTKDATFKSGFIPYYNVKELKDGKLLAIIDQKITRINLDGSTDTSFAPYSIAKTYDNKYDRFNYYQNGQINLFFSTYSTSTTSKLTLSSEGTLLNTTVYKCAYNFDIQNCEDLIFYGYFEEIEGAAKGGLVRYKTSSSASGSNPAGEIYQPFTKGQTLADLKVAGTDIKWYTAQSNCGINNKMTNKGNVDSETILPSTTLLVNGTTYYASQSINGAESSYRLPITVYSATLGLKENELPNLVTYPNPVKDFYTISNTEEIKEVQVYNILGQLQFSKTFNENNVKIDFTSLKAGLYFVSVYSGNKKGTTKVIKN